MDKLNPKRNVFKDIGYQREIHFGTIKLQNKYNIYRENCFDKKMNTFAK